MEKKFTSEGIKKIKEELEYLKEVRRREVAEQLNCCILAGNLEENSEYLDTKEAQALLENKILELEQLLENAVIVSKSKKKKSNLIQIGSAVWLRRGIRKERFELVGAEEANLSQRKISAESPLGKCLLNQPQGVVIEVDAPRGKTRYKVLKIE